MSASGGAPGEVPGDFPKEASEADPLVDLVIEEPGWELALPDLEGVAAAAVGMALDAAGLPHDGYSVSLLACGDERIAALNADFRGKPAPTNVLSWPAFPLARHRPGAPPARPLEPSGPGRLPLGDVAIALETMAREADAGGVPLKNHAMHLILHGSLHLLGYDHETPQDAELMEDLERRAMAQAGIADPYE